MNFNVTVLMDQIPNEISLVIRCIVTFNPDGTLANLVFNRWLGDSKEFPFGQHLLSAEQINAFRANANDLNQLAQNIINGFIREMFGNRVRNVRIE